MFLRIGDRPPGSFVGAEGQKRPGLGVQGDGLGVDGHPVVQCPCPVEARLVVPHSLHELAGVLGPLLPDG
ncbi:MAG: hypothetical protein RMK30_10740, partial [Anaerolineae bacterium]|nr:hypothetical protein [Anaerolineae bacterium]